MKVDEFIYLGCQTGVSKKTSKPYFKVAFYVKKDDYLGQMFNGFECAIDYPPEDIYKQLCKLDPLTKIKGIITRDTRGLHIYDVIEIISDTKK